MEDGGISKEEMYRRQLGGTNAALARSRQECKDLRGIIFLLLRQGIEVDEDLEKVLLKHGFGKEETKCQEK